MKVHPFQCPDLDRFASLYREIFPEKNITSAVVKNIIQNEPALIYLFEMEEEKNSESDHLIGFLYCWKDVDEIQIIDMGVLKKYRRQKFGSKILSYLFKEVSKHRLSKISLEVRSDNQAALGLYDKMGFVRTGQRQQYYSDGCDAILMDKLVGDPPKS